MLHICYVYKDNAGIFSEHIICAKHYVNTCILSLDAYMILRKEALALLLGMKSEVQ